MVVNQTNSHISDKEWLVTILLCFFLGIWGIHRFYVGKIGTGILMIFTLGGLGIWYLIDLIMIALGSFRDFDGREITHNSGTIMDKSDNSSSDKKFDLGIAAEIKEKVKEQLMIRLLIMQLDFVHNQWQNRWFKNLMRKV